MFVQVIEGQAANADGLHAAMDRWMEDLAPGASGWLGSTAGVTSDGRFVALVRFESEEAARRNSDRPEQGRWWEETSRHFSGDATFHDSTDALADVAGDPDTAGFVQVLQGRNRDPGRAHELMEQTSPVLSDVRPEIIGDVVAEYDDGGYTMAVYFTSEEEARAGERMEPPPELASRLEEMNALAAGETTYFDLTDPWLYSPR